MNEVQSTLTTARDTQDTDARLAARLKQLLHTPGISDKDRKLIDRNLQRLIEALEHQREALERQKEALERRKAEAGGRA